MNELKEERGYPVLDYLSKLSESDLFDLFGSICLAKQFIMKKRSEDILEFMMCPEANECELVEDAYDMLINKYKEARRKFGVDE